MKSGKSVSANACSLHDKISCLHTINLYNSQSQLILVRIAELK